MTCSNQQMSLLSPTVWFLKPFCWESPMTISSQWLMPLMSHLIVSVISSILSYEVCKLYCSSYSQQQLPWLAIQLQSPSIVRHNKDKGMNVIWKPSCHKVSQKQLLITRLRLSVHHYDGSFLSEVDHTEICKYVESNSCRAQKPRLQHFKLNMSAC